MGGLLPRIYTSKLVTREYRAHLAFSSKGRLVGFLFRDGEAPVKGPLDAVCLSLDTQWVLRQGSVPTRVLSTLYRGYHLPLEDEYLPLKVDLSFKGAHYHPRRNQLGLIPPRGRGLERKPAVGSHS